MPLEGIQHSLAGKMIHARLVIDKRAQRVSRIIHSFIIRGALSRGHITRKPAMRSQKNAINLLIRMQNTWVKNFVTRI